MKTNHPPSTGGGSRSETPPGLWAQINRAIDAFVPKVANGLITREQGAKLVRDQAGHLYDAEQGDALAREASEIAQQEAACQTISDELSGVTSLRQNTPEWQRASSKRGAREADATNELSFREWAMLDQGTFLACLVLCVIMLMAGAANIQGNLVASGLPLFTLNPLFAWLFAMLAPAAALAIHSFGEAFQTSRARIIFRMVIFSLTGLTVLGWSWLFADLFHGTGGLDLSLEGSGLKDTLFVWLQVAAEILVGASLFLIMEHIASKYSPNWWVRNLEHVELVAREERLTVKLGEAQSHLNALKGAHAQRMAAREAVINRAHADYLERLKRFGEG